MKQFIEKLIGRLEEIPVENRCCECPHEQKCNEVQENIKNEHTDLCGATIKSLSIDAVKEIAEEYINTSTDTSTTNADRIRSMTDEELAELFAEKCNIGKEFAVCWLQSEVEGVTENE